MDAASLNLANIALTQARNLSSVASEGEANAKTPAQQQMLVRAAFNAMAATFRAMGVDPMSTPYRDAWRVAYGSLTGPVITPVLYSPPGGIAIPQREQTVVALANWYDGLHRDAVIRRDPNNTDLRVRIWLDSNAGVQTHCFDDTYADSCNLTTGLFTSRTSNGSTEGGPYPIGDWRYFAWSDAPFQRVQFSPPLVWSLRIIRDAVARIDASGILAMPAPAPAPTLVTPYIPGLQPRVPQIQQPAPQPPVQQPVAPPKPPTSKVGTVVTVGAVVAALWWLSKTV